MHSHGNLEKVLETSRDRDFSSLDSVCLPSRGCCWGGGPGERPPSACRTPAAGRPGVQPVLAPHCYRRCLSVCSVTSPGFQFLLRIFQRWTGPGLTGLEPRPPWTIDPLVLCFSLLERCEVEESLRPVMSVMMSEHWFIACTFNQAVYRERSWILKADSVS